MPRLTCFRGLLLAACVAFVGCVVACAGPRGPANVHEELDVVYGKGGGEDLKLDLYSPKNVTTPMAAIVLIHGGGWCAGSKLDYRAAAQNYAAKGYVAVTVEYRLAPKHKWPAQIEDVKCAVRWLRANADKYLVDRERICAMGGSAGGHLALLLGFTDAKDDLEGDGGNRDQSSKVQVVVNQCGPTDATQKEWPEIVEKMFVDVLGGSRDKVPELYKQFSPLTYLRKDAPPVLTFHGTKDPLVPYEQAKRLDKSMRDAGLVSQLETHEGRGHGDFSAQEYARDLTITLEFLDKHLKKK